MSRHKLEICAADIDSVFAAARSGADRIELCSGLTEGGITPSAGLIKEARKVKGLKLHVLIRPRNGDFLYNELETQCMIEDIAQAKVLGADAVVIGALTADGDVDIDTCRRLMVAAEGMSVTFHRAFDLCRDPFKALEDIIALGCDRILTSGLASDAYSGRETLRELNLRAAGRIKILAGGGVTPANVAEIIQSTGVSEVHASAKMRIISEMRYRHEGVAMGAPDTDEYSRFTASAETIKQIHEIISKL